MLTISGPIGERAHDGGSHPERPARITAVMAGIDDLHLGADLQWVAPRPASLEELTRVHDRTYLRELEAFCQSGGGDLDPDTFVTADSWATALLGAGAGLAVIDSLQRHAEGVGFVAARPPGHHALRDRAMGFCLLNNVAIAASALAAEGERVLIVDWDVHHGNGTQAAFWDDPDVLYVSTHQWPLFPGTGLPREVGGSRALGRTVNIPLPAGATGDVVLRAMGDVALPAIGDFDPTWVLVSAGFDAHRADPLADLGLSSGDFAGLAKMVASCAPQPGRLVLFLEGGYDLSALRQSVAATLGALLCNPVCVEDPTRGGPGLELVELARSTRMASLRQAWSAAPLERRVR